MYCIISFFPISATAQSYTVTHNYATLNEDDNYHDCDENNEMRKRYNFIVFFTQKCVSVMHEE